MELEHYIPLEKESYNDYIERIKFSRENKRPKGVYMERHHIIPKSMGGNNKKENLIYLFPSEHYYAHRLLAIENPKEHKLVTAWFLVCHMKTKWNDWKKLTAEQYEEARKAFAESLSAFNKEHGVSQNFLNASLKHSQDVSIPVQCEETGEVYDSFNDAQRKTSINDRNIRLAALGLRQTAGGYHWKLINATEQQLKEYIENRERLDKTKQCKPFICVETGELYHSLGELCTGGNYTKQNISKVLHGKRKTAGRFHWEYLNPELKELYKVEDKPVNTEKIKTQIICIETGEIFDNQVQAARALGVASQNINGVINGHYKTVKGYHFERYNINKTSNN